MARHPFHEVVISGVYNTQQAHVLEGHDSRSITFDASLGTLADAGVSVHDVDGIVGAFGSEFVYQSHAPSGQSQSPAVRVGCDRGHGTVLADGRSFGCGGAGEHAHPFRRPQ